MNYLSTISSVFASIFRARARGGRIKRFLTFLFSFIVLVFTIYILQIWTHIPVSRHVIIVDHPVSTNVSSNHYVEVDIKINSDEGFSCNSNNRSLAINKSIRVLICDKDKEKGTTMPASSDISMLNYYLGNNYFTNDSVGTGNQISNRDLSNLLAIGHYYNSDVTSYYHKEPFVGFGKMQDDSNGKDSCAFYRLVFSNSQDCLSLPLGNEYHNKLCETKMSFTGDFWVDWDYLILGSSPDSIIAEEKSTIKSNLGDLLYIFKKHDISRTYFDFIVMSKSVDLINIIFESNEQTLFSKTFGSIEINAKTIRASIKGDHNSKDPKILNGAVLSFYTHNLESSNTQKVRLFFIMTLCSFALIAFLKCCSEYFWIFVRKVQKRNISL